MRLMPLLAVMALISMAGPRAAAQGVRGVTRQISAPPASFILPSSAPAAQRVVLVKVVAPADRAKAAEAKLATEERVLAFQRKRAEQGSPTAQYDLGLRFLKGDGVGRNQELAKKWLELAAKGGNKQAARQLVELKKPQPESKPETR